MKKNRNEILLELVIWVPNSYTIRKQPYFYEKINNKYSEMKTISVET